MHMNTRSLCSDKDSLLFLYYTMHACSPHYLRLWRTGAVEQCYRADEDEDFDVDLF